MFKTIKKKIVKVLKDLGNGLGVALGEYMFGGGR